MREQKEYILQFLKDTRKEFGQIPGFIHSSPKGGGVNYSAPTFDDEEMTAIIESVLFGKWLSAGESVRGFEKAFSETFGHKGSVMVNSGSSANLIMIAALKKHLGWNDGDEIILSVVGFPTTLSAITLNGLKPVFVDIEFNSLNFDLDKVREAITPKTRAVFLSPVLGNPPDMDELLSICEDGGVFPILDDCDSLGTKWGGQYLSDFAIASSCSFYPSHHMTTGQGGMISCNDTEVIRIARSMATWGRSCTCNGTQNLLPKGICGERFKKWLPEQDIVLDHKYLFTETGYNLQPLDLQGAIGLVQIKKFDEIKRKRILHHNTILDILLDYLDVRGAVRYINAEVSWFGVPVICPTKEYKVKLVSHLESNKIQTRNYFAGNILLHPAYSSLGEWRHYPEANKVLERVFFMGCSPNYTSETFQYIRDVIKRFTL